MGVQGLGGWFAGWPYSADGWARGAGTGLSSGNALLVSDGSGLALFPCNPLALNGLLDLIRHYN